MGEERQHWNSRVGFVMAAVGSAVGLGNVWRFPGVCTANGGGAFLIPFFTAIIVLGIPLLILEFGLGHMMLSAAPRSLAKTRRNAEWVGWLAVLNALVITIYYVVIMAWCCNYFVFSFIPSAPEAVEGMKVATSAPPMWGTNPGQFFNTDFLQKTQGLTPLGGLQLGIVAGLAFTWLCIFLIIYKGVGVVGKVVLWTVPLPVILLAVLFFNEIRHPEAIDGIRHYLTPNFDALTRPEVWRAAFGQVFFSLTLGFGVMIAYASYLKKKSDVSNNALITAMADSGTSFFAGFVVFSTIGYLASAHGVKVAELVKSDALQKIIPTGAFGLVFTTYPDAIGRLGALAPVFGAVFFLMLLLLGIDSAFSLVEGAASALVEKTRFSHAKITAFLCVLGFALGLVYCTQAGYNWVIWTDHICNDIGLPLVMLLQCIVVGWLFGAHKLLAHINEDSEIQIGRWWTFMIRVVCPLTIGFIFVTTTVQDIRDLAGKGWDKWGPYIGQWGLLVGLIVISIILMLVGRRGGPEAGEVPGPEEVTP
ncbi:MAG TPA: sodium-dependent transporter [Planctomycetota bacterium]|nr:sodium-dependent transporter [Planctomycetota bacterium]